MRKLYFGDNLDIMKKLYKNYPNGFADLIYIDPPFNSKRNYNVLFESIDLKDTKAQKQAFADTWSNISYMDTLNAIKEIDLDLCMFLETLDNINLSKGAVSYLTTMAIRIWYIHKLLKGSGSFYLHCDPEMSHYLKLTTDIIFGKDKFRSEIVWRRTNSHNKLTKKYGPIHDIILFYSKSNKFTFHPGFRPYNNTYIESRFKYSDSNGRYQTNYLTGPGIRHGQSGSPWKGFDPTGSGRHWAIPKSLTDIMPEKINKLGTLDRLEWLNNNGFILFPKKEGGQPMYKQYIGKGMPYQDIWAYQPNTQGALYNSIECIDEDVKYLENEDEILNYETQKPIGLLSRILLTSTNPGDTVADFFCGCGTTVATAEKLNRKWLGVDISHLSIKLIVKRLTEEHGKNMIKKVEIEGFPKDVASAKELAENTEGGRLKFEEWIVEVMLGGVLNKNRTQKGYDGYYTFDINRSKKTCLIEVKSGNTHLNNLNHFIKTVSNKNADMGVFICFNEFITKGMMHAVKNEGYFLNEFWGNSFDKIQILSVEDILNGELPKHPVSNKSTFKKAEKVVNDDGSDQKKLEL